MTEEMVLTDGEVVLLLTEDGQEIYVLNGEWYYLVSEDFEGWVFSYEDEDGEEYDLYLDIEDFYSDDEE